MTLRKFKNKIKRKSNEELMRTLINLNKEYYGILKIIYETTTSAVTNKDREQINLLERKIEITQKAIQEKSIRYRQCNCLNQNDSTNHNNHHDQ